MLRGIQLHTLVLAALLGATIPTFQSTAAAVGQAIESDGYDAVAQSVVERAQDEVAQIQVLVAQGTLPKSRLIDAQNHLADARDEVILVQTLYSELRLQDMTTAQADAMVAAANRRVDRQQQMVQSRRRLLDSGIMAESDFESFEDELESRKRVLELAKNRTKLLNELKQMAEAEQQLERAALSARGNSLTGVMIRYDGSGSFRLAQLPAISREFERQFHHPLPVSALGETAVHKAMGLDHRNRADISLNPDATEGVWLRQCLERLRIPYLAFRCAIVGAATAPHIHIGPGSTRLTLAQR